MNSAEAIRAWRLSRGLSQEGLAERARVSRQTVVRLETGRNQPAARTQARLAEALGITVGQLCDGPPSLHGASESTAPSYPVAGLALDTDELETRPVQLPRYDSVPRGGWGTGFSGRSGSFAVLHPRSYHTGAVVLRIDGDIMFPTLCDEDLVLVNTARRKPRLGEIVVVACSRFSGVTRYRMVRRRPHLAGDNPAFPPIPIADLEDVAFLGIVVALIRRDFR